MDNIILSLFAKETPKEKKPSPKNYPLIYSLELVKLLKTNYNIIQIGIKEESDLNCNIRYNNLKFFELKKILDSCKTYISVDSFFPHFAHFYKKFGVVIFAFSDPRVFGYEENTNLLKDRKFLRNKQFDLWYPNYNNEAFVKPNEIINSLKNSLL